jgi:hypothetical protein
MRFYKQFLSYAFAKEQCDLGLKGKLNHKLGYNIACMGKQERITMILKIVTEDKN